MSIWSFLPDDPYRPTKRRKYKPKKEREEWRAPEHIKMAQDMKRDFPRNDLGIRIGDEKNLVLDPRPNILRPQPKTVMGWL